MTRRRDCFHSDPREMWKTLDSVFSPGVESSVSLIKVARTHNISQGDSEICPKVNSFANLLGKPRALRRAPGITLVFRSCAAVSSPAGRSSG